MKITTHQTQAAQNAAWYGKKPQPKFKSIKEIIERRKRAQRDARLVNFF